MVYFDFLVIKTRQNKHVNNKAIYLALGLNTESHKELLGIRISRTKGLNSS
ncbi:MAG TPA: hypothetical protein DIS98_11495 [Colwellia sp.]|nr:hypothetical protein [Colwellia sp.]